MPVTRSGKRFISPANSTMAEQTDQTKEVLPPAAKRALSTRSKHSSLSISLRKKQAELRAQEEIAEINKKLVAARLEAEITAIDLEELSEELSENESVVTPSIKSNRVKQWVDRTVQSSPKSSAISISNNTKPENKMSDIEQLAKAIQISVNQATDRSSRFNKDLPLFHGNIMEWLIFKATFEESTTFYGFSDHQNMARLRQCVRGEARESITALLFTSSDPKEIMETLERRFGRPEEIVIDQVNQIKRLPKLHESVKDLNIFASKIQNCVAVLKSLKKIGYLHSPELFNCIMEKLTIILKSKWTDFASMPANSINDDPPLVTLSRFLIQEADRANHYGPVDNTRIINDHTYNRENRQNNKKTRWAQGQSRPYTAAVTAAVTKYCCGFCKKENHNVYKCTQFLNLSNDERWEWAKNNSICFRCLIGKHRRDRCRAKECGIRGCQRPHNKLLHADRNVTRTTSTLTPSPPVRDVENIQHAQTSQENTHTITNTWDTFSSKMRALLKIIPVVISGPAGEIDTYALLDEGASISLIDANIARQIGANGPRSALTIEGVNNINTYTSEKIKVKIKGKGQTTYHNLDDIRTVNKLRLTTQSITLEDKICDHLKHLTNKITCYTDAQPMILIGQDNWDVIISRKICYGSKNAPVASLTRLGWVLHGCAPNSTKNRNQAVNFLDEYELHDLNEIVRANFNLESLGVKNMDRINKNEDRANNLLSSTTRCIGKQWETGLLWKSDSISFPNNYSDTLKRLKSIEKKMDRDPEFEKIYTEQIQNLIDNGYAERVNATEEPERLWYLPHFAVTNPNKPGKVRLVFDAAARTGDICLNDALLTGPDLLNSLLGILFKFRQWPVAIIGDIKEMFLQVKIKPEDQNSQRFLWRGTNRRERPEEYKMTSMIFGATSSPCSALYVKNKNANEFINEFPEGVKAIIQNHYMDDYIHSVDSEKRAIRLVHEVTEIHQRGGFEIRGWASNKQQVLDSVPIDKRANGRINLSLETLNEKTLGLMWEPNADTLGFNISMKRVPRDVINGIVRPSKRQMLSVIMSVFDPLGLLAPITIRARILLQDVWRSGIKWDEPLKDREYNLWEEWLRLLKTLEDFKIPRCYSKNITEARLEKHTFCDASEKAYVATSYWRYVYPNGNIQIALIASKSRVTPLKPVSIPRLELQAALLGSRLANTIIKEHDLKPSSRTFWTDSKTTLAWINSDPRSYKAFVAHRLSEIDELTKATEWRWVPTKDNVADDATRNTGIIELNETVRWLNGPKFLYEHEDKWPQQQNNFKINECNIERRAEFVATQIKSTDPILPDITRFSSWTRLIRATAYVLLFIERCKSRNLKPNLEPRHLTQAEILWIKRTQKECFGKELKQLHEEKALENTSRILQLSPKLDKDGIMRLRGRVNKIFSNEVNTIEPIILEGKHYFTRLLVMNYHKAANHGSSETVVNELRQRYWIINLRPTVRAVAHRCQWCRIQKALPQPPPMGDLPPARLCYNHRPFTHCGLDYFGPMDVTIGRRTEKRYGALFTCLTTRAVHIELASSLTTDSAIMAIRRMIARRGCPSVIYSDNGTNFRGADAELKLAWQALNHETIREETTSRNMKWSFIPPAAPHMGGCWERMVRSFKTALRITLKERSPKEEVLATLLSEAENCINSRPLTHVSVDPRDEEALTPNHFLLGSSSGVQTPGVFDDADLCLRKQWRVAQRLTDMFWKRWIREYLPTLLPRQRTKDVARDIAVGNIVVIVDHTLPRNVWPRGRVTQTFPGPDGRVRVAEVLTKAGLMKRPVTKIIVLSTTEESADKPLSRAKRGNVDNTSS